MNALHHFPDDLFYSLSTLRSASHYKSGPIMDSGVSTRLGAHASPRAISGVSPETVFGETLNTTRETQRDAYAPQGLRR